MSELRTFRGHPVEHMERALRMADSEGRPCPYEYLKTPELVKPWEPGRDWTKASYAAETFDRGVIYPEELEQYRAFKREMYGVAGPPIRGPSDVRMLADRLGIPADYLTASDVIELRRREAEAMAATFKPYRWEAMPDDGRIPSYMTRLADISALRWFADPLPPPPPQILAREERKRMYWSRGPIKSAKQRRPKGAPNRDGYYGWKDTYRSDQPLAIDPLIVSCFGGVAA